VVAAGHDHSRPVSCLWASNASPDRYGLLALLVVSFVRGILVAVEEGLDLAHLDLAVAILVDCASIWNSVPRLAKPYGSRLEPFMAPAVRDDHVLSSF
jgi:hypothetical protein